MKQDIGGLPESDALDHIGALIDAAYDAGSSAGTDPAFGLLERAKGTRAASAPPVEWLELNGTTMGRILKGN